MFSWSSKCFVLPLTVHSYQGYMSKEQFAETECKEWIIEVELATERRERWLP